jgi:branched-subunit amino acid transport protein
MSDGFVWLAILTAALATYVWRALGVFLAGRLRADSAAMGWIGCVAYAILAGLIMRMLLLPVGLLEQTALVVRVAAAAVGIAVFVAVRRNVLIGVLAGTGTLIALHTAGSG